MVIVRARGRAGELSLDDNLDQRGAGCSGRERRLRELVGGKHGALIAAEVESRRSRILNKRYDCDLSHFR